MPTVPTQCKKWRLQNAKWSHSLGNRSAVAIAVRTNEPEFSNSFVAPDAVKRTSMTAIMAANNTAKSPHWVPRRPP